jgi:hypothetical protein
VTPAFSRFFSNRLGFFSYSSLGGP